jgi:hypothetical protein
MVLAFLPHCSNVPQQRKLAKLGGTPETFTSGLPVVERRKNGRLKTSAHRAFPRIRQKHVKVGLGIGASRSRRKSSRVLGGGLLTALVYRGGLLQCSE